MTERERNYMNDVKSWHNEFYRNVTSNIDEEILRPLFQEGKMGTPTSNIRAIIAMRKLKEGRGCSDEQLEENIRYNLLWRQALGLFNMDDQCPSIEVYYSLFRRIAQYEEEKGENLYKKFFQDLTSWKIRRALTPRTRLRLTRKIYFILTQ